MANDRNNRTILVYAFSDGSHVGELADVDCVRRPFDRVADLGIKKAKGVPIRDEDVDTIVTEVRRLSA